MLKTTFFPEADIFILYNISGLSFGKTKIAGSGEKKKFVLVSRTLSLVTM